MGTGTTREILRWAACKWGIDQSIVFAQAAVESWWRQTTMGDARGLRRALVRRALAHGTCCAVHRQGAAVSAREDLDDPRLPAALTGRPRRATARRHETLISGKVPGWTPQRRRRVAGETPGPRGAR
jgi:hypothetical protein